MNDIIAVQLMSWGVFSGILFVLCIFFAGRIQSFGRLCMKGIMGVSTIFIFNCLLFKTGVFLGINCVTVLVSALLGLPGTALMYGFLFLP